MYVRYLSYKKLMYAFRKRCVFNCFFLKQSEVSHNHIYSLVKNSKEMVQIQKKIYDHKSIDYNMNY